MVKDLYSIEFFYYKVIVVVNIYRQRKFYNENYLILVFPVRTIVGVDDPIKAALQNSSLGWENTVHYQEVPNLFKLIT